MDKLKLEPTSALVMQWIKNAFKDDIVQKFIEHLDLSSGEELYNKCNSICDWYAEVIVNRKYFVSEYIKNEIENSEEEIVIINLAAGKSPLALQVLEKHSGKIDIVLEIDISGMGGKQELYDKYFPEFSRKIKCITADITSQRILSSLNNLLHEYYKNHKCIIVLEGISYYLTKNNIETIVSSLKSQNRNNVFVFEYLIPAELVREEKRHIAHNVFDAIKQFAGLKEITTFRFENVSEIFNKFEAELKTISNLFEIEKLRLGKNEFFKTKEDGWIEFCVWKL